MGDGARGVGRGGAGHRAWSLHALQAERMTVAPGARRTCVPRTKGRVGPPSPRGHVARARAGGGGGGGVGRKGTAAISLTVVTPSSPGHGGSGRGRRRGGGGAAAGSGGGRGASGSCRLGCQARGMAPVAAFSACAVPTRETMAPTGRGMQWQRGGGAMAPMGVVPARGGAGALRRAPRCAPGQMNGSSASDRWARRSHFKSSLARAQMAPPSGRRRGGAGPMQRPRAQRGRRPWWRRRS